MPQRAKKILLSLLAALLLLTAAACTRQEPEAAEVMAAVETTLPPQTQPPTTVPAETEPTEERFLLTFAGDCTLGCVPEAYRAPLGYVETIGEDYAYPFRNVIGYFENDEYSIVNLEGTLTMEGSRQKKSFTFRGPPEFVNILTENSVEAVTLANNHTWDFGELGYENTLKTLEEAGVPYVQTNSSTVVTTKNGLTIGLYGTVYTHLDVEDMVEEITALKEQGVDLVIVLPHWGAEEFYRPNQTQINAGHAAIDAGADIVCGSHPHVLQPIEEYNGGVIYYSLGNFTFGGNGNPDDYDTVLIQQEVIRDGSGNVTLGETIVIPASVSSIPWPNNYQPTPYVEGSEEYDRVLAKLRGDWLP